MLSFKELPIHEDIQRAIADLGFETPSPIQANALPILLAEPTDFIGLAATGTGKTAAFGIPMLAKIDPKVKSTQALVLCPTRELALQVSGQLNLLGKHAGIRSLPVYGGSDYVAQNRGLKAGCPIVVGTPGRLIDHLERGNLKLDGINTVVLDEADEMISMGFKEDLEKILKSINRESSNIWLFSATMGKEVRRVASTYLTNPQQTQINREEMLSTTVEQQYYPARESDKAEIVHKLVESADGFYGLIFCQTKSLVADLTRYLTEKGHKVDCLHGDKSQNDRERTMRSFRDKRVQILVCTDVASRGLDVKDVSHVINYSIPRELDNYVHRIGRTARSGKSGIAISLVTPSHRNLIRRIEKMTNSTMTECKVPSNRDIGAKKVSRLLADFLDQEHAPKAMELLQEEWAQAIAEMSGKEIVGRFISLTAPELFAPKEKERNLLGAFAGNQESGDRYKKRSFSNRSFSDRSNSERSSSYSKFKPRHRSLRNGAPGGEDSSRYASRDRRNGPTEYSERPFRARRNDGPPAFKRTFAGRPKTGPKEESKPVSTDKPNTAPKEEFTRSFADKQKSAPKEKFKRTFGDKRNGPPKRKFERTFGDKRNGSPKKKFERTFGDKRSGSPKEKFKRTFADKRKGPEKEESKQPPREERRIGAVRVRSSRHSVSSL